MNIISERIDIHVQVVGLFIMWQSWGHNFTNLGLDLVIGIAYTLDSTIFFWIDFSKISRYWVNNSLKIQRKNENNLIIVKIDLVL
jgi:hypothetical protein